MHPVRVEIQDLSLRMFTADQVFSSSGLDIGTRVLLEAVPTPPQEGTFLDLGCGWGPIATVLAIRSPDAEIWAVDVSERALNLTARNAASLGLSNIETMTESKALERQESSGVTFDLIWSNPPVRIGKKPLQKLLLRWLPHLSEVGIAYLVISKNLGGDSMARWLDGQGFTVKRIASKKGFRVLSVQKDIKSQP